MLLEIPFNLEFADQIKEKSKADIMVYAQEQARHLHPDRQQRRDGFPAAGHRRAATT